MDVKEDYEWIQSWIDDANAGDLPRVLLIGDSITFGYQKQVRENLRRKFYVDYVATSMTFNTGFFYTLIRGLAETYGPYAVIHFNQGLHARTMPDAQYTAGFAGILPELKPTKAMILATSTVVYNAGLGSIHEEWEKTLAFRNSAVKQICAEKGYICNDLYAFSKTIPTEERQEDGLHYKEAGCIKFGAEVARAIVNAAK